jgi:hypothetical protein
MVEGGGSTVEVTGIVIPAQPPVQVSTIWPA